MTNKESATVQETTEGSLSQGPVRVKEHASVDAWNEYVRSRPGCLFHRAEWEQVFAVYGLPFRRLSAVRDGRIVGVLPLVWQRSWLFGNQFVSLPCFDSTGVLADDSEAQNALVEKAVELTAHTGAKVVLLRQAEPLDLSPCVRTDKVLMRLRLESNRQAMWDGLKSKVRNQVKKPAKHGLTVERGGVELLPHFFRVYSENMRDLGSPSHSLRFFRAVIDTFHDEAALYVVWSDKQAIGAGFTMANGDRLEIPWASSLRRYGSYCVNHLMYWEILADACQHGYQLFHFGRSTYDSGPYRFKKQWGPEPVQLYWYYLATNAETAVKASSLQESYGWGTRLWRNLPLWLSRPIGPRIIAKVA